MPSLGDHVVDSAPRMRPPIARGHALAAAPPACGLVLIQAAVLHDAAVDLVAIERQMSEAPSKELRVAQGLAAVGVLDRTTRLLDGQRAALLDQLTEIVLAAPRAEAPPAERLRARSGRPAGSG